MRYNKLKISEDATSRLRSLRQRTGVTPNLLCRAAALLSLEEGPVTSLAPDERGQEFNAYTLTGELTGLIGSLIRFVEQEEAKEELDDEMVVKLLCAHIHRGVGTLAVRAKSATDLGRLAAAA
ncbi:DNA sulfur modification protein DndE [Erythrobacter sp. HI0037]|nr:DNA sulfur modification protein DndE [Erythrobacter sp. HI0020]KZY18067.1 DNA sulfur modification protein DndE [Erythrobacter sp. HI0037]KZY20396.1 DNA sulfur modification protein DndE [Erythrobacter sp. HI0038]KZY21994.1 DNA sulfur modification protein DndE [Erythrobacter sp. HI0038]